MSAERARTWADYEIDLPSGAHGEIDVRCPQCTPSRRREHQRNRDLSVNVEKGTWTCHHCGWAGGLGQGTDRDTPIAYGAPLSRKRTYDPPRPLKPDPEPDVWARAVMWFSGRQITEATLKRNGITAAIEFCPVCDKVMSHVLFPMVRDGVHVNTKHRCSAKHFRMEKNAERILIGLDDCATAKTVVIVEGEIDKLSCEEAGWTAVLSVPDGAPTPDATNYASKFAFLDSAMPLFERATSVVLACDADAPGQALTEELARRIGREKCRRVTWPEGLKDANDVLVKAGPWELERCLNDAEPYPIEGVYFVGDVEADLDRLYERGWDRGLSVGWPTFDAMYRVRPGLFTVVTGIPSHGKSAWLDAYLVRLVERHGWTIGVCSPENQPIERHLAGIIAAHLGMPFNDGPTQRMCREQYEAGKRWAAEHFAFVLPESPTIDALLEKARALVFRFGIQGLVIDPWNEIEHSVPKGMNETLYISEALGRLRRFARQYDIHLWLVAHPTKLRRDPGDPDKSEPVPGLWDISGSANFRNKADNGLTVWRNVKEPHDPVQVHITKVRFRETGEPGRALFAYDRVTGRYREVG